MRKSKPADTILIEFSVQTGPRKVLRFSHWPESDLIAVPKDEWGVMAMYRYMQMYPHVAQTRHLVLLTEEQFENVKARAGVPAIEVPCEC